MSAAHGVTVEGAPRERVARAGGLLGLTASLVLHVGVAWLVVTLPPSPLEAPVDVHAVAMVASFDLESSGGYGVDGVAGSRVRTGRLDVVPGGGKSAQSVDSESSGDRGDRRGAAAAIYLLQRADALTQQDAPLDALDLSQAQRIRTADDRATREDRRSTPNPADDPFLASGLGVHRERRPVQTRDAATGARSAVQATIAGAAAAAVPSSAGPATAPGLGAASTAPGSLTVATVRGPVGSTTEQERGSGSNPVDGTAGDASERRRVGAERASPRRGILEGTGRSESEAARVASGRPPVDQAPAATHADVRDLQTRDTVDSELLAAHMLQAFADTSRRAGPEAGEGRGGVGGGGAPGSGGGAGEGGRARPFGPGSGVHDALDTRDERYQRWFLAQRRAVERHLVFPRERMLAMDQGSAVFRLVVRPDGTLDGEPHLLRSSGFEDFDRAARTAIVRALPFARVPPELLAGRTALRVAMPVHFVNPMTH